MITYLVDTDWMVDFLKGKEMAIQFFTSAAEDGLAISIITYAELLEGLQRLDEEKRGQLDGIVQSVDVLATDIETARVFAFLRSDLRTRGMPIPDHDVWIAATALRHDLMLVSRDEHFARVPGLKRHQIS